MLFLQVWESLHSTLLLPLVLVVLMALVLPMAKVLVALIIPLVMRLVMPPVMPPVIPRVRPQVMLQVMFLVMRLLVLVLLLLSVSAVSASAFVFFHGNCRLAPFAAAGASLAAVGSAAESSPAGALRAPQERPGLLGPRCGEAD